VEAKIIADFQGFVFGNADARAGFVIIIVGDGNHGVEAIVAAGELEDDEDAIGAADALRIVGEFGGHDAAAAVEEKRNCRSSAKDLGAAGQKESS